MRAKKWTHTKLMLMVPFAITPSIAYDEGGTHDYGWGKLQFAKDYHREPQVRKRGVMDGGWWGAFVGVGCLGGGLW